MNWTLPAHVAWTPTEYGGVLLDSAIGEYWTLNATAATMLDCLLAGPSPATDRLAADLGADPATIAADLAEFLGELRGAGLVVAR
ncbi:hypothetical protein ACWT_0888 [Actinoplanes sp. SE50]|uniref:lasso peptide biosynthesis PqqD family chaperone n=1 Tax=unclassified Actinoplanes TaxID=2626549 RepID=UPI00023EC3D9|nr:MULTISPECIES: lasso peptide biosynthesis PqqD family chaperone [unclassified Actinoplanes]AEV81902.1 hypothetical protein ACPL_1005 [Actinoplanes sp. SE50/110]ATO80303.1 hypothetical protein ACWT_0888 [Actinoplanes sp. SE50]SLL97708.1 hypothetical protein ACSP50_0917 [Actinoplanes sp. SE50/110]